MTTFGIMHTGLEVQYLNDHDTSDLQLHAQGKKGDYFKLLKQSLLVFQLTIILFPSAKSSQLPSQERQCQLQEKLFSLKSSDLKGRWKTSHSPSRRAGTQCRCKSLAADCWSPQAVPCK